MVPVGIPASGRARGPVLLPETFELGDPLGQLRSRTLGLTAMVQNTGAKEFGDVLQFVGGKALEKPARPAAFPITRARA